MEYVFSWSWFIIGFLVALAGAAMVIWFRPLADNLARGAASYERVKLYGIIACAVGFVVMLNLHSIILYWVLDQVF